MATAAGAEGCKSRCSIDEIKRDMLRLSKVEHDGVLMGRDVLTMRDNEPIHVVK